MLTLRGLEGTKRNEMTPNATGCHIIPRNGVQEVSGSTPLKIRKQCFWILVALLLMLLSLFLAKESENAELKHMYEMYCSSQVNSEIVTSTVFDCLELLIDAETQKSEERAVIWDDYPPYRDRTKETFQLLDDELDRIYLQYRLEIINACSFPFEYTNEEILTAFDENSMWIDNISNYYQTEEYGYAFHSYSQIHSVYEADCINYLVDNAYPKTFSDGIGECLLDVGVTSWSTAGEEQLELMLRYIDSMPNGRLEFEKDIETAKTQLAYGTAKHNVGRGENIETTNDVPYYGMSEEDINSTGLGPFSEMELCRDYHALEPDHQSITYYWYDSSGNLLFKARSYGGKIITTIDYRSGKPISDSPSDH